MTVRGTAQRDARAAASPARLTVASLLVVTVLGTLCNNVVSVPVRPMADALGSSLPSTVVAVSFYVLCLSIAMPVTGWLGDRWGMTRVLRWSLVLMLVGQALAATATSIELLAVARGIQGIACSAFPPVVMGMLAYLYPAQRLRLMAAWAAANGIGQAIGPPTGGLMADLIGWRSIFVLMGIVTVLALFGVLRTVPVVPGRPARFDLVGAMLLCTGVGAILSGFLLAGVDGVSGWFAALAVSSGAVVLALDLLWSARRPDAFLRPRLLVETRFLRSTAGGFAQMFALGTLLVVLPLHLTGPLGLPTAVAGLLFFALPVLMALTSFVIGRRSGQLGPRLLLRSGLSMIALGLLGLAVATAVVDGVRGVLLAVVPLLALCGVGIAMVQSPAAAGATRSPAGQLGSGLGFFNMIRFAGSTAAAAWVALTYVGGGLMPVLGAAIAVTLAALVVSFCGRDPELAVTVPSAGASADVAG